jgi:hypothetical protein
MVEEATKIPPHKNLKKKAKGKDEVGSSKVLVQKKTPSLVTPSKHGLIDKDSFGSKEKQGKKKVPKPREESLGHVDFHSSS